MIRTLAPWRAARTRARFNICLFGARVMFCFTVTSVSVMARKRRDVSVLDANP